MCVVVKQKNLSMAIELDLLYDCYLLVSLEGAYSIDFDSDKCCTVAFAVP